MKLTSHLKMFWINWVYPFNIFTRLARKRQIEELKKQGIEVASDTISTN